MSEVKKEIKKKNKGPKTDLYIKMLEELKEIEEEDSKEDFDNDSIGSILFAKL